MLHIYAEMPRSYANLNISVIFKNVWMFQDAWITGYCRVNQQTSELYCKIYHQHYCWKIYWFLLCMSVFLFAVIHDMKTFYLFLYNLFQWIGFSYIFITIMYRYLSYSIGMYNMPSFITPGLPSVLWRCWLGGRKGIQPVKNWVVRCRCGYLSGARCRLAYGPADATATHCLLQYFAGFCKIQIGFTFLVPAHRQRAVKRCVCVFVNMWHHTGIIIMWQILQFEFSAEQIFCIPQKWNTNDKNCSILS